MTKYNLIIVLDKTETKVLMCYRSRNPYKGLYNLLGGKIEENEDSISSAYRELFEESGIAEQDINLVPFMDFVWHPLHMRMDVYVGKLKNDVTLVKEVHDLHWLSIKENFFDMKKFAGEGNIGHMFEILWQTRDQLEI